MATTHEFSKPLGNYVTLTDLLEAVEEGMRDFNHDSRVSFRERSGNLTLVARWEVQPCWFDDEGCGAMASHLDDGYGYCPLHAAANQPEYGDDDEPVRCEEPGCIGNAAVFKEGGGLNLCRSHAESFMVG